jgi:splicing factor 3B subunit 1
MSDSDFETIRKLQAERNAASAGKKGSKTFDPSNQRTDVSTKASLTESFDTTLYERDGGDKFAGYNTSIAVADGDEDDEMEGTDTSRRLVGQYTASKEQMNEFAHGNGVEEDDILLGREKDHTIASRQTDYQKRQYDRVLTPTRADPFAANRQAGAVEDGHSYREVMARRELEREEERVKRAIEEKGANGDIVHHKPTLKEGSASPSDKENKEKGSTEVVTAGRKRKQRWDVGSDSTEDSASQATDAKIKRSRWDQTPAVGGAIIDDTPRRRSRWDQAPAATPIGNQGLVTPMHPSQIGGPIMPTAFGTDISMRNAPLSDEELDMMLPTEGYKILEPPPGYAPIRLVAQKLMQTPVQTSGFHMQDPDSGRTLGKQLPTEIPGVGDLQFFKVS